MIKDTHNMYMNFKRNSKTTITYSNIFAQSCYQLQKSPPLVHRPFTQAKLELLNNRDSRCTGQPCKNVETQKCNSILITTYSVCVYINNINNDFCFKVQLKLNSIKIKSSVSGADIGRQTNNKNLSDVNQLPSLQK